MTQLRRRIVLKIVLLATLATAATAAITISPFPGTREQCLNGCQMWAQSCWATAANKTECVGIYNFCVSRCPAH
jgi:hypothetical protein